MPATDREELTSYGFLALILVVGVGILIIWLVLHLKSVDHVLFFDKESLSSLSTAVYIIAVSTFMWLLIVIFVNYHLVTDEKPLESDTISKTLENIRAEIVPGEDLRARDVLEPNSKLQLSDFSDL